MTKTARYTEETARRVLSVTRKIERSGRDMGPTKLRTSTGDDDSFRLARFAGTWGKGTAETVELVDEETLEAATPALSFEVLNLAADVSTPDSESYGFLGACRQGRIWILCWFECDVAEAGSGS